MPSASPVQHGHAAARRRAVRRRRWAPVRLDVGVPHVACGERPAVRRVSLTVPEREGTAFTGPSGCGGTSGPQSPHRMNDVVPGTRVPGTRVPGGVTYRGDDLHTPGTCPAAVRPRGRLRRPRLGERVGEALTGAGLGNAREERVEDKPRISGLALSGDRQQRPRIARAIAVRPGVVLTDESCGVRGPVATARIEDLVRPVRHRAHRAARVSDRTAFFTADTDSEGVRHGRLVEYDTAEKIVNRPADRRAGDRPHGRPG